MHKRLHTAAAGLLAAVATVAGASAQDTINARETCIGEFRGNIAPEAFIAACTKYLESGSAEPEEKTDALANRASMQITVNRLDLALEDCRAALRTGAHLPWPEKVCGDVYFARGEYDDAVKHYVYATRAADKFFVEAWKGRITAELAAKRNDDAVTDASTLIVHAKDDAAAYVLRGNAYLALAAYAPALADFETALRLAPRLQEAVAGRDRANAALLTGKAPP